MCVVAFFDAKELLEILEKAQKWLDRYGQRLQGQAHGLSAYAAVGLTILPTPEAEALARRLREIPGLDPTKWFDWSNEVGQKDRGRFILRAPRFEGALQSLLGGKWYLTDPKADLPQLMARLRSLR